MLFKGQQYTAAHTSSFQGFLYDQPPIFSRILSPQNLCIEVK